MNPIKNPPSYFLVLGIFLSTIPFSSIALAATSEVTHTNHVQTVIPASLPFSYADAVALAAPAVVSINTTREVSVDLNPLMQDPFFRYFFGNSNVKEREEMRQDKNIEVPKEVLQGLGSGVIVNEKGYILTNYHLVKDVDKVQVTLADGRVTQGTLVGGDPDNDLAVLQIKLDKLPVIKLGSSKNLRAGDIVLAIGNPFGLDKTVTQGIISATDRVGTDIGILENLIQTDAAINPGNSGGALIDALGRLIGINTAIYTQSGGYQGIGFAIPIDQAMEIMSKIISGKKIVRGYLGIIMQQLSKELRETSQFKGDDGVYVRAIVQGSPAQKAGLLPGDVITKINNIIIKDQRIGLKVVASLTPEQNYPIEVFRKGEHLTFTITAGERKQSQALEKRFSKENNQ